jgi:chromosome segregation protein
LADSGLGRAGYSIVGQKEIDQALAASAEDRRAWVDEAAGVQRYRARKVESQRRLASAGAHLQRDADIVGELEAQREPLREEAEVAARYKSALTSLRSVESGLLIHEVVKAAREMEELQKRIEDSVRLGRDEALRAEKLEAQIRQGSDRIVELDREADIARKALQESLTALERAQADVRLGEERLRSLDELEQSLASNVSEGPSRIQQASTDLAALREEAAAEQEALEKLRIEFAGAGERSKTLSAQLKEIEQRLMEARAVHAEKLRREAEKAHRGERAKEAKRELDGIRKTSPELKTALDEAKAVADALNAEIKGARDRITQFEADLTGIRRQEEKDAQVIRGWLAERSALEGRHRGIEDTIATHEGLNQGARAVMEAKQRNVLSGHYQPVGEAIDVPQELALAIETALGGSVNDLIVDRESDAKAAIAWLKEHRLGRATFQPIPLMRPSEPNMDLRKVLGEKGVLGRASELVDCDPQNRPVIDSLLGRVVIVEDLDTSLRLAKTTGWNRLVTLDGEVVHSSGAVTGGHQAKQGYGLVQRKADLNRLEKEIADLTKKIDEAESRTRNHSRSRTGIETALKEQAELIGSKREEAEEANSFFQSLNDEWISTERSRQRIETELQKLGALSEEELPDYDLHGIEAERDVVLKQMAAGSADAEQAEERLREMDQRVAQSQARLQAAERRLHAAEED